MDPNIALKLMREAIAEGDFEQAAVCANELDEWLSKGGFLPDDWNTSIYMEANRIVNSLDLS